MNIFNIFWWNKEKQKPAVVGMTTWWMQIVYDYNFYKFYEYYEKNPYICSVINRIKQDVWWYGIEIQKNWKPVDISFLKTLIKNPVWYTPKKFIERLVRDYEITWNVYIYLAKNKSGSKVETIQVLDPRYTSPIWDSFWNVIWYYQNLNWIKVFLPDEIIHLRDDNDLKNELIWVSKMASLFIDIESDQEARESNLAFFRNNQVPAWIISIDPDFEVNSENKITLETKIKELFNSWNYSGWKNRHRVWFLQWIKEFLKLQEKQADWEFLELRKFSLNIVCSVFWVPQDVLSFTDTSNRSTGEVQTEIYYQNIEAKENIFWEFLTELMQRCYWPEYTFEFLKDNLRTLSKKSTLATDLYTVWLITLNEARDILQYDKTKEGNNFKNDSLNIDNKKVL